MASTMTPNARLAKIQRRMTDLEHQEVPKTLYGMGYGEAGTGKTIALVALAQKIRGDGSILYLDSKEGWVSLDNPMFRSLKRGVIRYQIDEPADLMVVANAILTKKKGFTGISVVLLDEGSSVFTNMLHDWVREKYGIGDDEDLPSIEGGDYAAPGAAFLSIVNTFMKIPDLHFLMVAHEQGRAIKGEQGALRFGPSFGPKLTNDLAQLMHVVGRFESRLVKGKYEREVQTWPTRYVVAKSRISSLDTKENTIAWVKTLAEWTNDHERMEQDLTSPVEDRPIEDEPDAAGEEDEDFEVSDDDEGTVVKS